MKARARASQPNSFDLTAKAYGLTDAQIASLKKAMREWLENESHKASAQIMLEHENEQLCQFLLVLHYYFGFGRKRLKRFCENWNQFSGEIRETFGGAVPNCYVGYSRMKSLYPDCEEWGAGKE